MAKIEDADEFRLRPSRPTSSKREAAAWSTALTTILGYSRSTARRLRAPGSAPGGGGRNRYEQRCAVRASYSPNRIRGQWRAHGRYLERERATGESEKAGFDGNIDEVDIGATLGQWQTAGDARLWKFIISPEFGERVDLKRLTRELMQQMQKDLGTDLEWVAVSHHNTEHAHVHVALRGVRDDASALEIDRDYLRAGIRKQAERLCTLQLGFRTELDTHHAESREVGARRFTTLDRIILKSASTLAEPDSTAQFINFRVPEPGRHNAHSADRLGNLRARLVVLQSMGLAEHRGGDDWQVRRDLEHLLRAMQKAGDRQKMLGAHGALLSDQRLTIDVLDLRQMKALEGRVLVHGEEEASGRNYLLMEGTDARVHLVYHTAEMARARATGQLQPNSFVRLRKQFENGRPLLEIEDRGNADRFIANRANLHNSARELQRRGVIPTDEGWGGWLGRYQRAMVAASAAVGHTRAPTRTIER